MKIAEVILPLPVKSNFDYRIPEDFEKIVQPGMRVLVPFGKNKIHTGVIKSVRDTNDSAAWRKLKATDEFLDELPVVHASQFALFEWIAFYYFCTEGEVLKAALPAGLKIESEWWVEPGQLEVVNELELPDKDFVLLDLLRVRKAMTSDEVATFWNVQNAMPRLRTMEARGLVRLVQRVADKYTVKTEPYLNVAEAWQGEIRLGEAFNSLTRAPKQEEVMMLVVSEHLRGLPMPKKEVTRQIKGSQQAISALLEKGFLQEKQMPVDRVESHGYKLHPEEITLNSDQLRADEIIHQSFKTHPGRPILLHGITGSGKTHLYIHLIREVMAAGKQALYLLPEIALTQQIIDRVKSAFGEKVGVYHSRFSDNERVEIWKKILAGTYQVVVGVRSSIFLPFSDLGIIVVDEEHDHSFKQDEPNPRYHARDLAVYLGATRQCRVVLGTATPSMESYHNALAGKYTLVELPSRAIEAQLPEVVLVDMKEQRLKKLGKKFFSQPLLLAIDEALKQREQSILFQNRRGFSPFLLCGNCGHVPRCTQCDISLTYHKGRNHLRCHYCGYTEFDTVKCPKCGGYDYRQPGIGTEKIEEEVRLQFPKTRVARMDFDTTRTRQAFQTLIRAIENHELDILVGTQMVSKGLDFGNVTLVGVIDADQMMNFADFRAYEHAYQLLTQVSGRAGRGKKKGRVLIQTSVPENPVLQLLQKDYKLFYDQEIRIREQLLYPPFTRLIRIEIRHASQDFMEAEAKTIKALLLEAFGHTFLGPEYPPVNRVRGYYRMQGLLKLSRQANAAQVREKLNYVIDQYYRKAPEKTMRIIVDVDPA